MEKLASSLVELQVIITVIHVTAGFLFCGLSIIHIIKKYKSIKKLFEKIIVIYNAH